MPQIQPIPAIRYAVPDDGDISRWIAPPYDVLDESAKATLLAGEAANIAGIDLPHLPAKTVGPDAVYERAGRTYRDWLAKGTLAQQSAPAVFVYQQTYTVAGAPGTAGPGKTFQRRGLIANVQLQPFGKPAGGGGGVHPHEQTFSGPKEDRLKLMRATRAQLSPIFGLYSDPAGGVGRSLEAVAARGKPTFHGRTANDSVLHEVWAVDTPDAVAELTGSLAGFDVFIADGHHRYNTALNYQKELVEQTAGGLPADHPANFCLFVLVAMQDPGMIVLPTHRVLGGLSGFSMQAFIDAAGDPLTVTPFSGKDLAALEAALPSAGPHAIGLFDPAETNNPLAIVTTKNDDPLAASHADMSPAWRSLDVAVAQHLIVEGVCQRRFGREGEPVLWKFPHDLDQLDTDARTKGYQLGLVMQATPLDAVRRVSEAGELMPQKSTFFYPKLATGLVINPLT